MITVITISISIILALAVRYLIVGKKADKISRFLFIICAVVLPIGTYLVIIQTNVLQDYLDSLYRPTSTGIVIKSQIVGDENAFRPEITYEYTIDSITYNKTTFLKTPMFGNKRKQYDVAKVTTEEHPIGKELVVYYDPDNPDNAHLPHALAWNVYGQIGFGAFLISISLFGLLMPRKKTLF